MHLEVKIKLLTPILGSKRSSKDGKYLIKDNTGENIAFDLARFEWAIREASIALGIEDLIRPNMIHAAPHYTKPTTGLYERSCHKRGRRKVELFECINVGTVLTWVFTLTEAPPGTPGRKHLLRPTEGQLRDLLSFIGEHFGLSQWGSKFGYGRFRLWVKESNDKQDDPKIRKSIYPTLRRDDTDSK